MEIFELLIAGPEICGCSVDLLAFLIDVWAGTSTVKVARKKRAGAATRTWPTVLLLVLGAALTTFVIARWLIWLAR